MAKVKALAKALEELKLYRGLRGPVVESGNELKPRQGYGVFLSNDPHVASSYANPMGDTINDWDDTPLAVFPLRVRPKKIIEFPTQPVKDGSGNTFDKFAFDRMASRLAPGEALVARKVYDAGPRANVSADPDRKYSFPSDIWAVGPDMDTTPLHKAKGGKVGALDSAYQYLVNHLPQHGFFSTLDELVENAPFENAPLDQWKNYLQPGRTLEREGVRFPLKKEELDYSFPTEYSEPGAISRDKLRELIRNKRPGFQTQLGVANEYRKTNPDLDQMLFPEEHTAYGVPKPKIADARFQTFAHNTGPKNYEELVTTSPNFGEYKGDHFNPRSIAHSRSTIQRGPNDELVRLIEEIQSDRHQAAATRGPIPRDEGSSSEFTGPRRGYLTPDDQKELKDLPNEIARLRSLINAPEVEGPPEPLPSLLDRIDPLEERVSELKKKIPDAPFKDPADYALLQLKQEMLRGARTDADALALVRGSDVSERFSHNPEQKEGNAYAYDKIYKGQLEKLARQYGLPTEEMTVPSARGSIDTRPSAMAELEFDDTDQLVESMVDELHSADPQESGGAFNLLEPAKETLKSMAEGLRGYQGLDKAEIHKSIGSAERELSSLSNQIKDYQSEYGPDEATRGFDHLVNQESFRRTVDSLRDNLRLVRDAHHDFLSQSPDLIKGPKKTFPAMKLSPEAREKIKRVGVPIWALGAATAGGSMLTDEDETPAFAEGGSIEDMIRGGKKKGITPDLQWIKDMSASMKDREPGSETRNRRMFSGLASQLYGLDEDGNVRFLGGDPASYFVPKNMLDSYREMTGTPNPKTYGPGFMDEIRTLFLGSQQAKDAEQRLEELNQRINERLELEDPKGFQENFDRSLGVMAGQFPIPTPAKAKAALRLFKELSLPEKLARAAKNVASPLTEFLAPTVVPTPGNYVSGALAGGVLGTLGDDVDDLETPHAIKKAEGGKVEATAPLREMLDLLRTHYDAMSPAMPFDPTGEIHDQA